MTTATSLIPEALCSDGKISAYGSARSTIKGTPLSPEELRKVDAVLARQPLPLPGYVVP